jgi:UDP-GlcNAc:undecaprenyl-phosphate GlcNAc-1-phosphate transferase
VHLLFAALLSMGITVMLIPPLIKWAANLGVLDQPGVRKVHSHPVPRVGGIAMAIGMLVAMLVWGSAAIEFRAYLAALLTLLIFGIQDDRLTLSPLWKLLGQVLAALIVMYAGHLSIGIVRHVDAYELPIWLSTPITLLFIVGVTNAINLADGLDGLAGGTTLLCVSGLLLLSLTSDSMQVAFVCVVLIGAVLGFLRYNTHPARIFMGDAGSQLLGFSAAVFSLMLTQDRELPFSATLPLLLLGVPVIDTLTVMTERVLDGRSPFQADRTHVHHRLLAVGFDHHEAVMVIYGAQALLLVLAWYLRFASDATILLVFACVAVGIVSLLRQARTRGWRWRALTAGAAKKSWLRVQIRWLKQDERLNRWVGYVIGSSIVGYAALLIINGIAAPMDIRILATGSALVVLISVAVHRSGVLAGWLERAALYVSALIAVSLDRPGALSVPVKLYIEAGLFVALTGALAIRLHLSADRRFRMTPLDVLVLLVAIALPNLPGSVLSGYAAGWMVAKVLLLLYGIENLSVSAGMQWRILTGGTLMFLAAVALSASS